MVVADRAAAASHRRRVDLYTILARNPSPAQLPLPIHFLLFLFYLQSSLSSCLTLFPRLQISKPIAAASRPRNLTCAVLGIVDAQIT